MLDLIKIISTLSFVIIGINALQCNVDEYEVTSTYAKVKLWLTPSQNTNWWWELNLTFDKPVTLNNFEGWTAHKRYASQSGNTIYKLTPYSTASPHFNSFDNGNQFAGQRFKIEYMVKFTNGNKPNLVSANLKGDTCQVSGSSSSEGSTGDFTGAPSPSPSPSPTFTGDCSPEVDDICEGTAPKSVNIDYSTALKYSMQFYEAQRSGVLPASTKSKIPWRDDSYVNDVVPGGYYDAGDNIKFLLPMASTITQLAWGGDSFFEAYDNSNFKKAMKNTLKWGTDFFQKSWTKSTQTLVVQIGDGTADHKEWVRPEDGIPHYRPTFSVHPGKPGTEPAAETAAALAASALFYEKAGYLTLAANSFQTAKEIFDFANANKGKYSDSVPAVKPFYNSWSGYKDELCWGAAFIYKASCRLGTCDTKYRNIAVANYDSNFGGDRLFFNWDNKKIGCGILLYEITEDCTYKQDLSALADKIINHPKTQDGQLAWVDEAGWGSLRLANNLGHACMQIARLGIKKDQCRKFAETQINYSLGDNPQDMSYMVGFLGAGTNYPQQPHHRASSIDINNKSYRFE